LGAGLGLSGSHNAGQSDAAATLIPIGALGYVLVPVAIHAFHNGPTTALTSLSVRVLGPGLGALIGAQFECPRSPDGSATKCESGVELGRVIGLLSGMALASLLDAGVFAYDPPRAERSQSAQFGLAPFLSADGTRGELRAYGTF